MRHLFAEILLQCFDARGHPRARRRDNASGRTLLHHWQLLERTRTAELDDGYTDRAAEVRMLLFTGIDVWLRSAADPMQGTP